MKRDPKTAMQVSEERIRERAYQLWLEEGKPPGREHAHWERARKALEEEGRAVAAPGSSVGLGDEDVTATVARMQGEAAAAAPKRKRGFKSTKA